MPLRTDDDRELKRDDDGEEQEELQGHMSFLDHLEELRSRIIRMLIAVAIGFAACFYFADTIFAIVVRPIVQNIPADAKLVATTAMEGFNLEIKLSILASIFLTAPFLMAQVWLFISPGLYKREKRYALPFIVSSSLLFITGGLFGYFFAFPYAINYLAHYNEAMHLTGMYKASDYFDLFLPVELGLGIIFEIPALIFVLSRLGLVTGGFLLRNTKYAILISAVVAAIITPTGDAINMTVIAVPMIGLYMLGVVVAYVFGKKRKKDD
jgi:sec-independent protein translocase protein TatC